MKVLEIIGIAFMALYTIYTTFIIGAIVYFGIIEPIHKAVRNLIESRHSQRENARAWEVRDM